MVDVFLIIICVVFSILCLFIGLYMLVHFQMDEDKNSSWFFKIIVTLSLGVSAMNVLLLPLDSLNRNTGSTLQIDLMCWIFTIASAVLAFVIIPFTKSLYENLDDEDCHHPYCKAMFGVIPFLIFIIVFFLILYFLLGYCEVPVTLNAGNLCQNETCLENSNGRAKDTTWSINLTVLSYILAMLAFLGYILLVVFGGIGFITLPVNLISDFIRRPKPINLYKYERGKALLHQWANELIEQGALITEEARQRGYNNRKVKKEMLKLEQQVDSLEHAFEVIEVSYKVKGGNPIIPWIKLFMGIICIIMSLLWVIHIIVFTICNAYPFLNTFLNMLNSAFALSGVIFFGVFVYYLYWVVLSGVCSFGMSCLLFRVHPMEAGNTPMTSILFNSCIMLFASFGIALFSTINFPIYTRITSLNILYGVQVQLLFGLRYVWQYGIYIFLGFIGLSFIFKIFTCARKKDNREKNINEALMLHDVSIAN